MNQAINVFDTERASLSKHKIRIILHSDSLEARIMFLDEEIRRIDALNEFDEIEVFFSIPTSNLLKMKIEENFSSGIYGLEKRDRYTVFITPDGKSSTLVYANCDFDILKQSMSDTKMKYLDRIVCDNAEINYIVVEKDDCVDDFSVDMVDSKRCLELIRLFMLNQGLYYAIPNYKIDEILYYIYRMKKTFTGFQYLWSLSIHVNGDLKDEKLMSLSDSLSTRLEFYCRTYDRIAIECLRTPNNYTSGYIHYHFNYLVVLIIGILDNLAWIIRQINSLKLGDMATVLKLHDKDYKKHKESRFIKELMSADSILANFLFDTNVQDRIRLIYPFRDTSVHRELFKTVMYENKNSKEKLSMIQIPAEVHEFLANSSFIESSNLKRFNDLCLIDPYAFIVSINRVYVELVNEVLTKIDYRKLAMRLSEDANESIEKSVKTENPLSLLGIKFEPLYL